MTYAERKTLISDLEGSFGGCKILCYILPDRATVPPGIVGFATQLGSEPHLLFIDQLRSIGKTKHLALFLYTRGGDTDSVWPLISLLREYCEKLTVIVPFRAHSGGTLICLGADEVILMKSSELSPIDPTTTNQFNPVDPNKNKIGISVEDVTSYFKLSNEIAGIKKEAYKLEVFKELTRPDRASTVHPLSLGNVQRVYMQIRRLAKRLLELHLDEKTESNRINKIVKALTEEFYSHSHAITPTEIRPLLGDFVRIATDEEEEKIWKLFNAYADTVEIRKTFVLPEYMGDTQARDLIVIGGFIESMQHSHIFSTELKVMQLSNLPPNVQVQVPPGSALPLVPGLSRQYQWDIRKLGWKINSDGV